MSFLQLQHVSRRFDNGSRGLANVSVSIEQGSMVFLTGHSGAGKSTLLKMLIGAEQPTSGRVLVDGSDVSQLGSKQMPWYRRQVGVVLQDHNLLEDRSVFDNVALPLRITHLRFKDVERRVRGALSTVELSDKGHLFPRHLSTGEQQRVGIARAVVNRPRIILADEPTGNLDTATSLEVMQLFSDIQKAGNTVILVTHEEDIAACAHRTVRLRDGKVESDG